MTTRRDALGASAKVAMLLAASGFFPKIALAQAAAWNEAAFNAKNMAELMKAFGANAPTESKDIAVQAPDIAENGAVVPIGATVAAAGARRVMLLVEKNPNVLAATFDLTDAVDAAVQTRVKMGQSSDVYAVAQLADGKLIFNKREVKVTLGGCGG